MAWTFKNGDPYVGDTHELAGNDLLWKDAHTRF